MADPATHVGLLQPYWWWACDHPERPDEVGDGTGGAFYSERCRACMIAFKAEILRGVHSLHATYSDDGECTGFISPEEALAAAEAKLAQL